MKNLKLVRNGNDVKIEVKGRIKDKRHVAILNSLIKKSPLEAINYINSFNGTRNRSYQAQNARSELRDSSVDRLAEKHRSGHFLRMFERLLDASANHVPSSKDRGNWLGVEIECFVSREKTTKVLHDEGINARMTSSETERTCEDQCEDCSGCDRCSDGENCCEGHTSQVLGSEDQYMDALQQLFFKRKLKRTTVKHDGSIDAPSTHIGLEFTVLFRRNDRTSLAELCRVLRELGASVNRSCGLHVHLDQRDLIDAKTGRTKKAKVMKRGERLGAVLPLLASMLPHSRRSNSYCRLETSNFNGNRYSAINMTAFKKYNTIEVRLHSGTTDLNKINNWIDLLLVIQNSDLDETVSISTLEQLCEQVDLPEKLIEYIEKRVFEFTKISAVEAA